MSLEYRMEVDASDGNGEYAIAVGTEAWMMALLGNLVVEPNHTVRVMHQSTDELVFELCPNGLAAL